MQIVDDRTAAQIEEVLAHSTIACPSSLPTTNMSQCMLNSDPFTQLASSLRGLLTLAQLNEQGFVRMDTDAASFRTGRALGEHSDIGRRYLWESGPPRQAQRASPGQLGSG